LYATRAAAVTFLLLFVSGLSYAQNDNSQGNEENYPAVPSQNGGLRPHVWIHKKIGPNAAQANMTILNPSQIRGAYGINAVPGLGQGATIAIVDAYDAPNAAADLAVFSSQWGISCATGGGTFTKVNQSGQSSPLPGTNSGWEMESNLDVQWAHAIAPCANIVLVEANSNNDSDLLTAVSTAASLGSVVSMSWGSNEFSSQTSFDSFFVGKGVTFLASSGDTGGVIEWPSSSTRVVAVGGTNLTLNPDNSVASETAWNGSGGGCSAYEQAISPQTGLVPATCTKRATPDVSMNGGSASPVYTYISDQGGWYAVYGTSLSVQLWGGVIALANGQRSTPLDGTLADLYADAGGIPSSAPYTANYRDITSGQAGSFSAGPAWDFITGLGSPLVNSLVPSYLVTQGLTADFSLSGSPASQTVVQGNGTSYTVTVTASNGFSGIVGFSASGLPSGVNASFNPTSVTGSGSSSVTVTTSTTTPAGTYTLTFTGTSGSLTHSTTATLVVNAAVTPDFSISANPTSSSVTQGNPTTSTITLTSTGGFSNAVTLSATGSNCPTSAVCTFSVNPVTPTGSSVLTIATSTSTPPGIYKVVVTGTSGVLSHSVTVTVTVNADFTISASPINLTVPRNASRSETIGVGLAGVGSTSVTLSISGLPPNTSATFSPNTVTSGGAGSNLTISARRQAKVGTYTVTVSGTNGTSTHTASFNLTIQ
jgi:subtilase family serine protease